MSEEKQASSTKDVIDAVGGIVNAVPVYQDAIQPAAKELGKALQTATKSIHVLLAPLEMVIWGYERIKAKLSEELAPKIQAIPEVRRISPKPNVAVPVVEALRYLGADDSLRGLYVNLLASAMDIETAYRAHPSFAEIIKQLTSDEAKILQVLSRNGSIPLLSIHLYTRLRGLRRITGYLSSDSYSYQRGVECFSNVGEQAGCECVELTPNYLDNLARLGLIEKRHGISFTDAQVYADLEAHESIGDYMASHQSADVQPRIERYSAGLTSLGKQFIKACVVDGTGEAQPE